MNLYLSASFSRKAEIKGVATQLENYGYRVVSDWLETEPQDFYNPHMEHLFLIQALTDLDDIGKSDVLIRFSDDLSQPTVPSHIASGARMFEMGYAYKKGLEIIVVGGKQNIFDALPSIFHVDSIDELLMLLKLLEHKHGR